MLNHLVNSLFGQYGRNLRFARLSNPQSLAAGNIAAMEGKMAEHFPSISLGGEIDYSVI
jgi:hypothetical protein